VRYACVSPAAAISEMYENTRAEGFGAEVPVRVMIGTLRALGLLLHAYYLRAQKVRPLISRI